MVSVDIAGWPAGALFQCRYKPPRYCYAV